MPVENAWRPLGSEPRVVVAAAVVEAGRMLVAQRSRPAQLRGQWELPGGKVEPGESEPEAVARECAEELGIAVEVLEQVGGDWPLVGPLAATAVLHVWLARRLAGHPAVGEAHLALRWVTAEEWTSLPWLAADLAVLPRLAQRVRNTA